MYVISIGRDKTQLVNLRLYQSEHVAPQKTKGTEEIKKLLAGS
jgi:hypothetical protein